MAMRVQIEEGGNGVAEQMRIHPQETTVKQSVMQAGKLRGFRIGFWDLLLAVLCFCVWIISSEGFRLLLPTLGWKFYRAVTPLYHVPFGKKLDSAMIFALALIIGVACVWDRLLRQLLKVDQAPGGAKWYRTPEAVGLIVLGLGLLAVDAALVCLGVSAMSWGKAKLTSGALLVTAAYVLIMLCLSWMRVDSKRKLMLPAILLMLLPSVVGCDLPEDETFRERQSEYVVTFIFDTSDSFEESVERAWKFLEANLEQLYRDRAGSNEDLVILSRISGDLKSPLWIGSPRDIRDQFSSAQDLRGFLRKHAGDTARSRVYEAMMASMDRMMRNPSIKNGSAKSVLVVLSDLVQTQGAGASGADVVKVIERYAEMNGAIGLFFVADGLDKKWDDKLTEIGIRHTVKSADEVNPLMMSFE